MGERRENHRLLPEVNSFETVSNPLIFRFRILAARKLSQFDGFKRVPATLSAVADAVRWAEEIMMAIDERWPAGR